MTSRLVSLDFLRGITVFAMILVNTPGDWANVYAPLLHATWHGCTPTDLIFPFFLLIVGLSLHLSLQKVVNKSLVYPKIFKRAVGLFVLGLGLSFWAYPSLADFRIMGVLQRIGIVFLVSSVIFLHTQQSSQLLIIVAILLAYWALLSLVPVGDLAPNLNPTTNLAAFLDQKILGNHVWRFSKPYDPEGILSTLPSVATCLLGVQLGFILKKDNKIVQIFIWGFVLLILAWFWQYYFPFNKQLWTSSFVLFTAGWAYLVFGVAFYLFDKKKLSLNSIPFCLIFGANATVAYVLSGFLIILMDRLSLGDESLKNIIYKNIFVPFLSPKNASLAFAFFYVGICFLPVYYLYHKKIFIKL